MPFGARAFLTLLSAALVIAAFPPLHWHWLALMAWLPFILSLRGASPKASAVLGLLHGMLVFSGTLIWLTEIFGPMALLLQFILAMFTVFFAMIFNTLDRPTLSPWWYGLMTAVLWTGIEYFRSEWFTLRFPWITPGTALPPNALTQVIGVYGVSLVVILASTWLSSNKRKTQGAGIAVLILLGAAFIPRGTGEQEKGVAVRVSAVQGETLSFDQYMELSASIPTPTQAIVWPEYALSFDLRENPEKLGRIRHLMAEKEAEVFVVGSLTRHPDKSWSNTSIIVGRDTILGSHDKNRPVHFFDDGEAGVEAPAWPTPIGRISTPICFDNDYSAVPREAVKNGAELLLIPSMDAQHWTARQHLQHAELFRHRAAENGRWLVVAASSGMTQVIDPSGKRVDSLPLFDPGVLDTQITSQSILTPYTRFGWIIGPICTIAAALLMVAAVVMQRRDMKKPAVH
ncbi:apolipoprotein N-acyltransferase [Haloferula chungangensis]|uniref:Apolipoprotein N-acyltransferase n=1 Tax=Haloferula chungangensis TaxID=1048331 RepID=A0ABW2L998_9BACT